MRFFNAAGTRDVGGIGNDRFLVFQCRIRHEGNITQKQQVIDARDFKHADVGKRLAGTETDFLVQHTLKKVFCVEQSLHVHVCFTVMHKFDCFQTCLYIVCFVDDPEVIRIDIQSVTELSDFRLIPDKNDVDDAELSGFFNCFQYCFILSAGNRKNFLVALTHPGKQFIK